MKQFGKPIEILNDKIIGNVKANLKYGEQSWAPPRTQTTPEWKNFPWPGGDLSYPKLPLFQNSKGAFIGGRNKEYTFKPGRLPVNKLLDNTKCLNPPTNLLKSRSDGITAEYQILETIPCSIIKSDSKDSMTLPDVISIDAKSQCPYQTHAWLYEKFESAKYSISFSCMYFTFNAENCPYCACPINSECTPELCNLKPEVREKVQKLVEQLQKSGGGQPLKSYGEVLCGNCINSERGSGCCNPYTGWPPGDGYEKLGIKLDPNTGTPADGICDRNNIRGDEGEAPRYHPNGYAIWDSLIRAVKRGVKLKIIFAWPCMVDSALSLKSMLYLKSLNPSSVQLFPFNVTSFFRNDPTQLYVLGKNQEKIPVFTANDVSDNTPYGGYWNCPSNSDNIKLSGDIDTTFAPTGFPSGGSGILHSKIYTIDYEDPNNCAMYTGAQNATYDGSLELGIGISRCPELVNDAQRILEMYALAACIQNKKVDNDIMQPQAPGTVGEMINNWNTTYKKWNNVLKLGANNNNPYTITLNPEPRPNGLDGRLSFNTDVPESCSLSNLISKCKQTTFNKQPDQPQKCTGFNADVYLTNCPKVYCDLTNSTYDLQGIIDLINSAKNFVCINVMDWIEITTYLTCTDAYCSNPQMQVHGQIDMQSPWPSNNKVSCSSGKWKDYNKPIVELPNITENQNIFKGKCKNSICPDKTQCENDNDCKSIINLRGPQVKFTILGDAIVAAAMRGVTVKILVGQRGKQPCGDDPNKFVDLMKRNIQINALIKKNNGTGSMEAKYFVYLCDSTKSACFGAFHQKFIVTDEGVAISSSNYVGDYFASTHGISFMQKTASMAYNPLRDDLLSIFKRNFKASKHIESIVCKCASQGWPNTGTPLPGASPHYFCKYPDCGLSFLNENGGSCDSTCPSTAQDWPKLQDGSLDMDSVKCGDFKFNDTVNVKELPTVPIGSQPPETKHVSNTVFIIMIILAVIIAIGIIFIVYKSKNKKISKTLIIGLSTLALSFLIVGICIKQKKNIGSIVFCLSCILIIGMTIKFIRHLYSKNSKNSKNVLKHYLKTIIFCGLLIITCLIFIILILTDTLKIGNKVGLGVGAGVSAGIGFGSGIGVGVGLGIVGISIGLDKSSTPLSPYPSPYPPPLPPLPPQSHLSQPGIYKPIDPIHQKTTNGNSQTDPDMFFPPSLSSSVLFNYNDGKYGSWIDEYKRYNLDNATINPNQLKIPNKVTWKKDCLSNYFKILYPAVNSQWFDSLNVNLLSYLYSKLDWYYTPLVIHPQQPSRSREELMNVLEYKDNDRQRPILAPYYNTYVPNFSMGISEVVTGPASSGGINDPTGPPTANSGGATANVAWPWPPGNNNSIGTAMKGQGLGYQWPKMTKMPKGIQLNSSYWTGTTNQWTARPTMEVHFLAPWGRSRHGYPSYSYLECVSGGQELSGIRERGATSSGCHSYLKPGISSYGSDTVTTLDSNFQDFSNYVVTPPVKYPVDASKSPAYQGIGGYFSKLENKGVSKPICASGLPSCDVKETFSMPGYTETPYSDGCNECTKVQSSSENTKMLNSNKTCPDNLLCGDSGCVQSVKDYRSSNVNWCQKSFYKETQTGNDLPKDHGNVNKCGNPPQPCNIGWGAKHGTCLYGHSGFIGNPWLLYSTSKKKGDGINATNKNWLLPAKIPGTASYGLLKDPITILDSMTGLPLSASTIESAKPIVYVLDPKTGKPTRAAEIGYFPDSPDAFCSTSDSSDSCRIPQDLFYPEKGYGKFINTGRTGVFFNNWHALLTLHDKNGEGKQYRWVMEQFMALNTEQQSSAYTNGINPMITARAGNNVVTDNREYLSGFYTFPKNNVFGMNLEPLKSTIIKNWSKDKTLNYSDNGGKIVDYPTVDSFSVDSQKGIPIKCSDPGGIVGVFVSGEPQVKWSGKSTDGAGQTFWQKGMDYTMPDGTIQHLSCENPWMNPMDDGEYGRLTYIGKNFVQYYIPPELGLKNPYYGVKISQFYPGGIYNNIDPTDTKAIANAYSKMAQELGMPSDSDPTIIKEEFALRWVEASTIYGDNGLHSEINSWPWGTQSTATSSDGSCLYKAIGAMGWNTVVVTMKPCRFGQPSICETPYYDSELIYLPCDFNYKPNINNPICKNNCVNGMSSWAGPLGVDFNVFKTTSCPLSKIIGKESLKQVTLCVKDKGTVTSIYQDNVGVCSAPFSSGPGYFKDSWLEDNVCSTKPENLKASGFSGIWESEEGNDPFHLYLSTNPRKSAHTKVCQYMRYIDISKCLDLYLKWGFVPAFNDRSTPSLYGLDDCHMNNKNHIYWNTTPLNREFGAMSEISSDIPAQVVRQYFAPPENHRTNFCSQCPEMAVAYVPHEQFKNKNYLQATEPYRGIPFISSSMGEGLSTWCGNTNPRSTPTKANITELKLIASSKDNNSNIAPVYKNNTGMGNGCTNIMTAWGRRGNFGSFDYIIPSKGNEYMNVMSEFSTANKNFLACHEVQSIIE
jgi:hypothetical protein